jgi:protein-disulfide isomerase
MSGKAERQLRRENREQEEQDAEGRARRKRLGQLGMAGACLAIIVIAAIIIITGNNEESGSVEVVEVSQVEKLLDGIPQHGTVLGNPSAKVTLIEFGDLQCPICKEFSEEVIPKIIEGQVRAGEAKIEFRNFTIISEQSIPAGAAALAAGEQGRAWNFIELFYRNQREERSGYVTSSFLNSIAKGAKVPDLKKWNEQRETERLVGKVESTTEQAETLEFTGTPSFAVKGPNGFETLGTPQSVGEIEAAIREGG